LSEYQSSSSSAKINKSLLIESAEGKEGALPQIKHSQDLSKIVEKYNSSSSSNNNEKNNQNSLKSRHIEESSKASQKDVILKSDKEKLFTTKKEQIYGSTVDDAEAKNLNMLSNPIESHYSREQDLRYTSLSDVSRSISSYAIDSVTANRLAMQDYDMQGIHSTNHRPYDSSALVNSQTAFERYDPNYSLQRTSMYSPYCQPTLEELASQQKYILEQQQPPLMKTEPDDSNNGPVYHPRPIYHAYDPTGIVFQHKNEKHNLICFLNKYNRLAYDFDIYLTRE
jgi:hypothetical protein